MSTAYRNIVTRVTPRTLLTIPQSQMLLGSESTMKQNNAGGYAYKLDDWKRLDRFLILGSVGGTYYVSEKDLTKQNVDAIRALLKEDGIRVVNRLVEISESGRAPRQDPALFVMALAIAEGDVKTKHAVVENLSRVARIGTHLFTFVQYATQLRGWGRVLREAVSRWYTSRKPSELAYQVSKYQQRESWSHRDVLRLSHAHTTDPQLNAVLHWAVKGWDSVGEDSHSDPALQQIWAFERAKRATSEDEIVKLIRDYRLPRECIPTQYLNSIVVWEMLLESMPMTAMIRNLAKMTRVGLLVPNSHAVKTVVDRLSNDEALKKARIHPIAVLSALRIYGSGGQTGRSHGAAFTPVASIVSSLDDTFYRAFGNVEASGKRLMLGLDVSGSMGQGEIAGVQGLTPRDATACMAMVTARKEWDGGNPLFTSMAFSHSFQEFPIRTNESIQTITDRMMNMRFGGTDCSLPIQYAMARKIPVDTFIVYTDNETWSGKSHIKPLLAQYSQIVGIPSKLITVGMTATDISIADPNSSNMLDVVGFDAATPEIIRGFSRGEV